MKYDVLNNILRVIILCFVCLLSVSCHEEESIKVTGITVNPTSLSLNIGESGSLTATVSPKDAENRMVIWIVGNGDIVSVSNGTVTALKEGSTTVTAKTDDGGFTASCSVTVTTKSSEGISISLSKSELTLEVGGSETITATVTADNTVDKTVTWSSSDPGVALVDGGKITAVKAGTAVITAKAGNRAAVCNVTVVEKVVSVESITLSKSELILQEGEAETLVATVKPDNATDKSVVWSTSDSSVATVQEGKVTAVKAGSATITAKAGGKTVSCTVTVIPYSSVAEAVDLGLSVKWSTHNIGASSPEGYGEYFAWGETESKSNYTAWSSYKWCYGSKNELTKYSDSYFASDRFYDHKTVLDPEDDVAHVNWGGSWRMPTDDEWTELRENCTWSWTTQNGVSGYRVTSKKAGYTDKSIFIPAAGFREDTYFFSVGSYGYYWSSSLWPYNSYKAFSISLKSGDYYRSNNYRYYGFSVRPVYGEFIFVESISLNKSSLYIMEGEQAYLTATISPSTATEKTTSWLSSNSKVATVDSNGRVIAVSAGTATITVWASDGKKSATCKVTVRSSQDAVDLGLSVKWATYNVGATSPEEFGDYYAWGETEPYYSSQDPLIWKEGKESGYAWGSYRWCMGSYNTMIKYCNNSSYGYNGFTDDNLVIDPADDAAHVNLGGSWRMPTYDEWTELIKNCTWTWTTQNGVSGYRVTSKKAGYTDKSIFIPAAGHRYGYSLSDAGSGGIYWSSSLREYYSDGAMLVFFGSGGVDGGYGNRYYGLSVRPVYSDVDVTSISLNKTYLTLTAGDSETLIATVSSTNTNVTDKTVDWSSNNTAVVTVSNNGVVTAKSAGTATITASAGGKTANCIVTVTQPYSGAEAVDLGLSVKWASYNLGASSPEGYGNYFAWGETEPKSYYYWSTYKWCNGSENTLTKYCSNSSYGNNGFTDNKTVLDLEDDAARVNWGGSWRMPTYDEWTELRENCTWSWTTQNGVSGYRVTSKKAGYTDKSIFIPAAGHRYGYSLLNAGSSGYFWYSSLYEGRSIYAGHVGFYSGGVYNHSEYRYYGLSVRPVSE